MSMPSRLIRYGTLMTTGALALALASSSIAQDKKSPASKRIYIDSSSTLPLKAQLPQFKDYALQLRLIVLEPGSKSTRHSHAKRPVVAYLLKGQYVEHRDGQPEIVHKPGEQWVEGADVTHWSENRGKEDVLLINVEVVPLR